MRNNLQSPKEKGLLAGTSIHLVQVKPIVPRGDSLVQTNLLQPRSFPGDPDEDTLVARTVGCATAPTKTADRGQAASAQAVKRGPQVQMEEVPDHEDDMSFRLSHKTNRGSSAAPEVTQLTVAEPLKTGAKTEKVPHEWLKPFGAEWTLRGIKEARMESEVRAILKNWIHKTQVEEVVNKMLEGLRGATCINALDWMEEL